MTQGGIFPKKVCVSTIPIIAAGIGVVEMDCIKRVKITGALFGKGKSAPVLIWYDLHQKKGVSQHFQKMEKRRMAVSWYTVEDVSMRMTKYRRTFAVQKVCRNISAIIYVWTACWRDASR